MELLSSNVEGGHLDLLQNFLHSEVQLEIHTILLFHKFPIYFLLLKSTKIYHCNYMAGSRAVFRPLCHHWGRSERWMPSARPCCLLSSFCCLLSWPWQLPPAPGLHLHRLHQPLRGALWRPYKVGVLFSFSHPPPHLISSSSYPPVYHVFLQDIFPYLTNIQI